MGINDLIHFDFMDPPPAPTLLTALEHLYALSALDEEGLLTRLGRKMADFPLDPALSKTLIVSVDYGCSEEALSIVAMLQAEGQVFYRPKDKQAQADAKKVSSGVLTSCVEKRLKFPSSTGQVPSARR